MATAVSSEEKIGPPPTSHELDHLQHHISLQEMGERVQKAANAAFPNGKRMRYSSVYALILSWEEEDPRLPVSIEANELRAVFEDVYRFQVETWKIPSEGSHKRLNRKVLDFVELGGDSKNNLKIVYYGGHGMLAQNRQSCWASRPNAHDPSFRTVKWSGIQHALEEAESDVLLLFDCCASGSANTDIGNGVTELIAACGFNASANPVGPDSFTRALITELRLLSMRSAFTVGVLYNKILCRVQNWMPEGRELQKPPLHVTLTQNWKLPQGIQLAAKQDKSVARNPIPTEDTSSSKSHDQSVETPKPIAKRRRGRSKAPAAPTSKRRRTRNSSPKYLNSPSCSPLSQESIGINLFEQSLGASSDSSISSDKDLSPRIALTIRLKETLAVSEASTALFEDWIRMMPLLAEHIKIEAGFGSFSTLLIMSVTIPLWCYLEDHPAISLMGMIRTSNFVTPVPISLKISCPETVQPISNTSSTSEPVDGELKWVPHEEALIEYYEFCIEEDQAYFKLVQEIKSTITLPRRVYLESMIPFKPPWKCHFVDRLSNDCKHEFEGPQSLALHYIVSHSMSVPCVIPEPVSRQFYPSLISTASRTAPHQHTQMQSNPSQTKDKNVEARVVSPFGPSQSQSRGDRGGAEPEMFRGKMSPLPEVTNSAITVPGVPKSDSKQYSQAPSSRTILQEVPSTESEDSKTTQSSTTPLDKRVLSNEQPLDQPEIGHTALQKQYYPPSPPHSGPPRERSTSVTEDGRHEHSRPPWPSHIDPTSTQETITSDMSQSSAGSSVPMSLYSTATSIPSGNVGRIGLDKSNSNAPTYSYYTPYDPFGTGYGSNDSAYSSYNSMHTIPEDLAESFSTDTRNTPSSLGWDTDGSELRLYTFKCPKAREPYLDLIMPAVHENSKFPQRVYLDSPKNLKKAEFPCQYPGCFGSEGAPGPFKRPAGLERHYQNVHLQFEEKDHFPCDYHHCERFRKPLTRKEYLRSHFRDFHKEDIGSAKGFQALEMKTWAKHQEVWISERKIVAKWWRCPKCLRRVQIEESGWKCPVCKHPCDKERVGRIEAVRANAASATSSTSIGIYGSSGHTATSGVQGCPACSGTAWTWNSNVQSYDACAICLPTAEHYYIASVDDARTVE